VAGLLTSDMFGLTSTVDKETQSLLEEQRALSSKTTLESKDKTRLEEVSLQLDAMGFRHQMRDPEYTRYLQVRDALLRERMGPQPTSDPSHEPTPDVQQLIREAVTRAIQGEKL